MFGKWLLAVALLVIFSAAGLITGCNTTAGVGRDMSSTWHAITREAEEAR